MDEYSKKLDEEIKSLEERIRQQDETIKAYKAQNAKLEEELKEVRKMLKNTKKQQPQTSHKDDVVLAKMSKNFLEDILKAMSRRPDTSKHVFQVMYDGEVFSCRHEEVWDSRHITVIISQYLIKSIESDAIGIKTVTGVVEMIVSGLKERFPTENICTENIYEYGLKKDKNSVVFVTKKGDLSKNYYYYTGNMGKRITLNNPVPRTDL